MTGLAYEVVSAAVGRLPVDALTPVRESALATFSRVGFPTVRDEDWKYTNLSAAADLSNAWLADETVSVPHAHWTTDAKRAADELVESIDANWIVIANGITALETVARAETLESQGILVTKLSNGRSNDAIISDDAMTSLNAALLRDGLRVTVRPSAYEIKPLAFLFIDDASKGRLSAARIIIDVAAEASIDIIEAHVSIGTEPHFENTVVQLDVADNAHVGYLRIQERAATHLQVGILLAGLHRDAALDYASFDLGSALARNDVAVDVLGTGATVRLHGLYLASGHQHIDNHTRVDHRVGPAASREEYRGILSGRARCVFNGKAIVHKGADGTDAEQSNHNLLLSDRAEIDTKPELEIYADDVKCAHGATVGQLDKAAIFYLRSRGLGEQQARQVLTRAFAARILTAAPIAAAHECLGKKLDRALDALVDGDAT